MKAKNLYYVMALCAAAFAGAGVANAQDVFVDDAVSVTEFTCDNSSHYYSNWRDNWFIEISAGGNQPIVERGYVSDDYTQKAIDKEKWTVAYSVGVGRWLTPYLGLRLKGMYGSLHWDTPNTREQALAGLGWSHSKHASATLELMWDMFNSLGGVNSNRVFSIIPFVGFGGDANWDFHDAYGNEPVASNVIRAHWNKYDSPYKNVVWTLPVTAGLQFRFRLCKYVDFFAEARAAFYSDNWNNNVTGNSIEMLIQAMGGFNFNIGGRGWNTFNECNYVSQIAALNGQVNDLRNQLIACGQALAACQAQLPCPEPKVVKDCEDPLLTTVSFTLNSSKILETQEVNLYRMAQWLKDHPDQSIVVAGYADRNTGNSTYNQALSERRVNAVIDYLVDNYGIARDRLISDPLGDSVQPFSNDAQQNPWNRIVIFNVKK